jgi:hypothetical protein
MKTRIALCNCTRPAIERKLIEANFKQYIDDVIGPENLLRLKQQFDHASARERIMSEYQRIYSGAFWFAVKGFKRKEHKTWKFIIGVKND